MIAPTSFFADYGCHVRILEEARVLRKLGHEITIAMPNGKLSKESIPEIEAAFLKEYELRYNRSIKDISMETVTWRVIVSGATSTGIRAGYRPLSPSSVRWSSTSSSPGW